MKNIFSIKQLQYDIVVCFVSTTTGNNLSFYKRILNSYREGGDIGLFITLIPKVLLLVGITTLGTIIEF